MKYHINQQVRVRPDLRTYFPDDDETTYFMDDGIEFNTATPEMASYAGEILTVIDYEDGQYVLTGPADVWWTDGMLLPYTPKIIKTKELS